MGVPLSQFPNFASWFNYNTEINDIQFLNIGGTSGALANSSNNANFVGDISFVAFLPEFMAQQEAAAISGAEWPIGNPLVFSKHDLNIQSDDDAVQLSDDVLETLNSADNITILAEVQKHDKWTWFTSECQRYKQKRCTFPLVSIGQPCWI